MAAVPGNLGFAVSVLSSVEIDRLEEVRSDIESLRGPVIYRLEGLCRSRFFGPQIRRGYPPNLSISFSGGKETKEDSPSNGERTGIKPSTEPHTVCVSRNVVFGSAAFLSISTSPSPLERGPFPKRVIGPCVGLVSSVGVSLESSCL